MEHSDHALPRYVSAGQTGRSIATLSRLTINSEQKAFSDLGYPGTRELYINLFTADNRTAF